MPRPLRHVVRSLAAIALASLGACAKADRTPDAQAAVTRSTPVSATTGAGPGAQGSGDSTSTRADRGRIRGSEQTQVWLVEVSDFQCPYCKKWHDDVYRTIDREYVQTGKIRVAYVNFPLSSIHPNAQAAAEAAMCAAVQGKFWELHDALFETQESWATLKDPTAKFDSLATAAKVNPTAWRSCVSTHATAPLITADREQWGRVGVRSTPSFFVGNRGLVGAYPADTFRVVLDSAIAHARVAK